jgi:sulfofructose kinase
VDVGGVLRVPGQSSGASVVVVDRGRGTRAICNRPAPGLVLEGAGVVELIRDADWVHVDHAGWGPVHQLLAGSTEGPRPRVAVDAGNPIAGFEPRGVDLYVPTYAALVARYAGTDVGDPVARALEEGVQTVVATRGGAGAVAAAADGRRAEVPGCATRVVSTLGAGDVFHGALLAAVVRGYELAEQLAYANAAAALSCRGLDGRSAIPSHRDVLDLLPTAQA